MTDNKNTICPAVWDHLCINTHGKNRLCCNSTTGQKDYFLNNFDEHWGPYRDRIKAQMLNGERPPECVSCWKKEDSNVTSLRQYMILKYTERDHWEEFLKNIETKNEYPKELDLKLGNHCNLSCRMCSSYSSSKYQAEFKKIYKETGIDISINEYEKEYVQDEWYETEEFYNKFVKIINGLVELKFTGGEPLIMPNVKKALIYCCDQDKAKDIHLSIITNGTKINKQWIDVFLKFKHSGISVSIDGVEDTYEYIRYPIKWSSIHKNLKLLSVYESPEFKTTITFTLQLYNILQAKKMIELKRELNCNINVISLDTPQYLDVRNAPPALKEDALAIIDSIKPIDVIEKDFLKNFKNTIKQPPYEYSEELREKFLKITLLKDPYRKQDFTKTEIYKYFS